MKLLILIIIFLILFLIFLGYVHYIKNPKIQKLGYNRALEEFIQNGCKKLPEESINNLEYVEYSVNFIENFVIGYERGRKFIQRNMSSLNTISYNTID